MPCQTRVIQRHRVPLVPRVDVDAGVEEVPEAVHVAGARGLKDVAVGDLLQGSRGAEVGWVEVDAVDFGVDGPRFAVGHGL